MGSGLHYFVRLSLLTPYQNSLSGSYDAVVVETSPSGTLAPLHVSWAGPSDKVLGTRLAVDPSGNAYADWLCEALDFRPQPEFMRRSFQVKLPPGLLRSSIPAVRYSGRSFVGGTSFDYAYGIAADEFGNSYITGAAYSASFPNAPPGGAQPVNRGNGDAFVAKLNFNGSALLYFTFLGGSGTDQAQGIAVDPISGIAVVTGSTTSTDLSVSAGALQSANAGGYDGFVAKLNAAGSAFLYTTYLGGNRRDILLSVAIDPSGNAYVAGYSDSNTFPTSAAIQPAVQGNSMSVSFSHREHRCRVGRRSTQIYRGTALAIIT